MKHHKILTALLAASIMGSTATATVSALTPYGTGLAVRDGWLKNDPDYSFSTSYRQSVWYRNFEALELSGNARTDVLAIALSQLGYHGGPSGDYSGTYSGSATSDDYKCTEYARLLIDKYGNHFQGNAFDWCACFVNWCFNQARVDYASSELGCWRWAEELKAMGMFQDSPSYGGTYAPQPADMIFFNWDGNNTYSVHIGLVLYTTADRVYTVEGNAGNQVKVRSYKLNDPCIIGYGTPPYEEGSRDTADHAYKGGMPSGEYVLGVSGERMKTSPGGTVSVSGVSAIPLGERVTLIFETGDHALVRYGGKQGYIPKKNLYLLIEAPKNTVLPDESTAELENTTEAESDIVEESDVATESDIEVESDIQVESDTEWESNVEIDVDTDIERDTEVDSDFEAESDTESESESESEPDTEFDTESEFYESCDDTETEFVSDEDTDTENIDTSIENTTPEHAVEETETVVDTPKPEECETSAAPVTAGCAAATSLASLSFLLAGCATLLRRRREK